MLEKSKTESGQLWRRNIRWTKSIGVDTVFCMCQNDQSGQISRGKLLCTLTADENQFVKMVADEWWWSMEKLIYSGVADKVGDVIVDADEGRLEDYCRWNRKYADGKEVGEISIVIEANREIDRSWFPFLYLLEYDSCKESRVSLDMDLVS